MSKLVVCGDSFMSSISFDPNDLDNGANKHFTELLGKKIKHEVISLARGACSNQTIRLQIEETIKLQPDLVIIGLTSVDRIEYPIQGIDEIYNPHHFLANINYNGFPDKSSENTIFNHTPKLISETISNIFDNNQNQNDFTKQEKLTLLCWFERFYDSNWKNQQDSWIIHGGLKKLQENNINFYCVNPTLFPHEFNEFGGKIIDSDSVLNPWNYFEISKNVKYRFHTTLEEQEILANLWYNKLVADEYLGKNLI